MTYLGWMISRKAFETRAEFAHTTYEISDLKNMVALLTGTIATMPMQMNIMTTDLNSIRSNFASNNNNRTNINTANSNNNSNSNSNANGNNQRGTPLPTSQPDWTPRSTTTLDQNRRPPTQQRGQKGITPPFKKSAPPKKRK